MTKEELESAIFNLVRQARAKLARARLLSLEESSVDENLELWLQESERRLQKLRVKPGLAVDADESVVEDRASLAQS